MSHQKFLADKRREISEIARGILAGDISPIDGARRIVNRQGSAELLGDEDVTPFVLIDSETDTLPLGEVQSLWNPKKLAELQPNIDSAEAWAREIATPHYLKLVDRFG